MKIRSAKIKDIESIHALITTYAQDDRMLFRSKAFLYENIQMFNVATDATDTAIGCCALQVVWQDLAEIKSLAVATDQKGKGIGKALITAAIADATTLGLKKVFALTLEPDFFKSAKFTVVDKKTLPMKVWSDCARCPKQDHCDETAVELAL